jgi:hypothetical protein
VSFSGDIGAPINLAGRQHGAYFHYKETSSAAIWRHLQEHGCSMGRSREATKADKKIRIAQMEIRGVDELAQSEKVRKAL